MNLLINVSRHELIDWHHDKIVNILNHLTQFQLIKLIAIGISNIDLMETDILEFNETLLLSSNVPTEIESVTLEYVKSKVKKCLKLLPLNFNRSLGKVLIEVNGEEIYIYLGDLIDGTKTM